MDNTQDKNHEVAVISDGKLTVAVSARGGELQSVKTADGNELLWQGDETFWRDRAPNLFPYVGRMWEGKYTLGGKTYPMTIHGFIKNQILKIEDRADDRATFTFVDTPETREIYPFSFLYSIEYRVADGRLNITFRVKNKSDRVMYFGIGGHPGFNVPMEPDAAFEDYCVRFEGAKSPVRIGFSELCFRDGRDLPFGLSGKSLKLAHSLFDDDAIVLKNCGHTADLVCEKSGHGVRVCFPDMPYLGLWHRPHSEAPYVCIEPWGSLPAMHGAVPELESQPDLISLKPAGEYVNRWSIETV